MENIYKCPGLSCPQKETCYRFTAPDLPKQGYFDNPPLNADKTCDFYWKDKKTDNGKVKS